MGSLALHSQDSLTCTSLISLLNRNLLHHTSDGRRHFQNGFIRLQFQNRLIDFDRIPNRNQYIHHRPSLHIFTQFRQLEFNQGRGFFGFGSRFGRFGFWFGRFGCRSGRFGCIRFLDFLDLFGRRCFCHLAITLITRYGQNNIARGNLIPFFNQNLLYHPLDRRGDFNDCLIRLKFQDRLIHCDAIANGYHHINNATRLDIFAQLGDFKLNGHLEPPSIIRVCFISVVPPVGPCARYTGETTPTRGYATRV